MQMKQWVLFVAVMLGLVNHQGAQSVEGDKSEVQIASLHNGVKTYIQKNTKDARFASLRVVLRKPSCDQILYAHDGYFDSLDSADHFFHYCSEKMKGIDAGESSSYFCSSILPLPDEESEEIAIVAVGDFSNEGMQEIIQRHFSKVQLKSRDRSGPSLHIAQNEKMFKVAMQLPFPHFSEQSATEGELWVKYLIEDLFENRLERCTRFEDEMWVHPYPRFLKPVSGYALVPEEVSEGLLSYLLWQKKAVAMEGFTEEEFYVAKRNLLMSLQYLSSKVNYPDAPFLAAYYVDQFLMGRDASLAKEDFLKTSYATIDRIELEDLNPQIESFFNGENDRLHLVYPSHVQGEILTAEKIGALHEHLDALSALYADYEEEEEDDNWPVDIRDSGMHSSQVRLVNQKGDREFCFAKNLPVHRVAVIGVDTGPFYHLPINEKEKELIEAIVLTMAEKNVFQLAFEKRSLEKKGKRVNGVHPLRFIGHIFSSPELKRAMRTIRKSSFKWDGFLDGFSKRMKLEYEDGNLFPYVSGFSEWIHADPEVVAHYIEKRDWEGLLIALM